MRAGAALRVFIIQEVTVFASPFASEALPLDSLFPFLSSMFSPWVRISVDMAVSGVLTAAEQTQRRHGVGATGGPII